MHKYFAGILSHHKMSKDRCSNYLVLGHWVLIKHDWWYAETNHLKISCVCVCVCVCGFYWLQAAFAEADLRLSELKKRTYEFDREVVKGAVDPVCLFVSGESHGHTGLN